MSSDRKKDVLSEYLIADAVYRCRAIAERCAALAHSDYSSTAPHQYAELVSRLAARIEGQLLSLDKLRATKPAVVRREAFFLDDYLRDLGARIRYIEGALSEKLPWSLSRPLEQFLEQVLPDKKVLLRPQWSHNYTIIIDDLYELYYKDISELLSKKIALEVLRDFPRGFHIVAFPAIERKNVLLHCDLFHEIGHLVADRFLAQEKPAAMERYLFKLRKSLSVPAELSEDARLAYVGDRQQQCLAIRKRAIEELASDIFAARAVGIASLFALSAISSTSSLDLAPTEENAHYPPWRMRLRIVLEELTSLGYWPDSITGKGWVFQKHMRAAVGALVAQIEALVAERRDEQVIASDLTTRIAYESVTATLPRFRRFLDKSLAGRLPPPIVVQSQIGELVSRLIEGIVPNELMDGRQEGEPAHFQSILNAAWYYRIAFLAGADAVPIARPELVKKRSPDLRTLYRLTLRAAELAALQKDYKLATDQA